MPRVARCFICNVQAVTHGDPPVCVSEVCRAAATAYEERFGSTLGGLAAKGLVPVSPEVRAEAMRRLARGAA